MLTPTCVGRTVTTPTTGSSSPAHPYVRGEDVTRDRCGVRLVGSPPRAWGGPFLTCCFTFALEVFGKPSMPPKTWQQAYSSTEVGRSMLVYG